MYYPRHCGHEPALLVATSDPCADRTLIEAGLQKFTLLRQQAFIRLQDVHESIMTANISGFCPLTTGNFIIARHPHVDSKQVIVFGQGMLSILAFVAEIVTHSPTVLTKSDGRGSKYDWSMTARS